MGNDSRSQTSGQVGGATKDEAHTGDDRHDGHVALPQVALEMSQAEQQRLDDDGTKTEAGAQGAKEQPPEEQFLEQGGPDRGDDGDNGDARRYCPFDW